MNKDIVRLITHIVCKNKIRYISIEYQENYQTNNIRNYGQIEHIKSSFNFNWRQLPMEYLGSVFRLRYNQKHRKHRWQIENVGVLSINY